MDLTKRIQRDYHRYPKRYTLRQWKDDLNFECCRKIQCQAKKTVTAQFPAFLSAADEQSPVSSPVRLRRKPSKLQQPVLFTKRSPSVSRHIMRPTAQKMPTQSYLNNYQQQSGSLRKKPPPAVPCRTDTRKRIDGVNELYNNRSSDKVSGKISVEAQLNQLLSPQQMNGSVDNNRPKTSTPKSQTSRDFNGTMVSPIQNLDAYTYMKLHEMKRRSDAELLRRSESCQPKIDNKAKSPGGGRNYDLIRGSPLRTTVTGGVPFRSQSVLDGLITTRSNATPTRTLDKKQIMNELYAFYRRSVNNTPVTESELYSIPAELTVKRQPITNPRFKAPPPPSSSNDSKRYVVFDSEKITPMDVIRHRSLGIIPPKEPMYRNSVRMQARPSSVTPGTYANHYQLYNVSDKVRYDGRNTPLILSSPAKVLRNPGYMESGYGRVLRGRPIDPRIHEMRRLPLPIPYESDTASEAGEVQKIFRGRQRGM